MRFDVAKGARQVLAPAERPVHDEQVALVRNAVPGEAGPGRDRDRNLDLGEAALE